MDGSLHELKNALQVLALPVTGQVYLVREDCTRVEILADTFNAAIRKFRTEDDKLLTLEQARSLTRLEEQLVQGIRQSPVPICSELSMRQSAEWRQIRATARETLASFDWSLEIPLLALPAAS